jgi:hypothetical protein
MDAMSFNLAWFAAGMVLGLLGWMLYWAGLPAIGGLIGAALGGALAWVLSGIAAAQPLALTLIGMLAGGVLGVLLMRALQYYFFFAAGASLGGALAWNFAQGDWFAAIAGSSSGLFAFLAVAAGAIAGGLTTIALRRYIVAVITACIGATMVSISLPMRYRTLGLAVSLVVFLATQIGLVRRYVDQEDFDRRTRRKLRNHDTPDVDTADDD